MPPTSFIQKKSRIISQLALPEETYDDLSPKGSVDAGIRELIGEINGVEGYVTTSSCAGRVSVFLEGRKSEKKEDEGVVSEDGDGERGKETIAGPGGKGGGGRWLFVSHDPVEIEGCEDLAELLGMSRVSNDDLGTRKEAKETRFIHLKFEPMILHVLTASLQEAQTILSAALQAGFRESGALNLVSSAEQTTPMVGIRTMGLALESLVGYEEDGKEVCMVPEWQLKQLLEICNERFGENAKRIERFRRLLRDSGRVEGRKGDAGHGWEDKEARRERKRAEGLKRSEEARRAALGEGEGS